MKKLFILIFVISACFVCLNANLYPADIEMVLGDASGGDVFSIQNSSGNEVSYIDSRGNTMFKGAIQTYINDYIDSSTYMGPWQGGTIGASPSTSVASVDGNHPGVRSYTSGSTAYSGYRYTTDMGAFVIAGGEYSEFIFYLSTTSGTHVIRMGFQDSKDTSNIVDGVWINIAGTALTGKTSNGSVVTTTGTCAVSTGTTYWYRAALAVNSDATRVDFYLYLCSNGNLLWTDNVTTNIPTTTGRETGHGWVAYRTAATATSLWYIDYMSLVINRVLQR